MSNRHLARTLAMQTLFNWDFNDKRGDVLEGTAKEVFSSFAPDFDDKGFVDSLVHGVVKNIDEIDKHIIKYATE